MIQPKMRGDTAEILFLLWAASLGLRVSKPYGDSYPYDSIVDNGHTCYKVQIKSSNRAGVRGLYQVNANRTGKHRAYRPSEVDFLACYIFRTKTWYIIPQSAIGRRSSVILYGPSRRECGMFAAYFEAWHLLKEPRPCGFCLQACADTEWDGVEVPEENGWNLEESAGSGYPTQQGMC